ncbi:VOC family protein [Hyalangium gracile]|uniref:VOC family protein n=1 Tax=Hyalangium gracile TaxID=394092 RepID=UPI001CCC2B74|nr:VOC family protein [Hyalangium gracile]
MSKHPLPGLTRVDHVGLTVPDLDAAVSFYTETLGATELFRLGPFDAKELPRMADGRDWTEAHINVPGARLSIAMLQLCANLRLELFRYELPQDARTTPPRNCDIGGHHLALKVSDLDAAVAHLRSRGVRVMDGCIAVPRMGLRAHYFLDPWGNQLELVEYKD